MRDDDWVLNFNGPYCLGLENAGEFSGIMKISLFRFYPHFLEGFLFLVSLDARMGNTFFFLMIVCKLFADGGGNSFKTKQKKKSLQQTF